MRTISPKKEEKKKAKKTNKAKQPEDRGWLDSKDPVFSLPHNVGLIIFPSQKRLIETREFFPGGSPCCSRCSTGRPWA